MGIVSLLRDLDILGKVVSAVLGGLITLAVFFITKRHQSKSNFQNYRSTKVYDRQINAIIDLHKMLTWLHEDMVDMTLVSRLSWSSQEETEKEQKERAEKEEIERKTKVIDSYLALQKHYLDNSILLPKETADKVESL